MKRVKLLYKIHSLSGIILFVFIIMHLSNHLFSLLGEQAHINWMNSFRVIYRNPIVETVLLFTILVQIFSGLKLFFSTKKIDQSFFDKLQRWSGLYLSAFLIFHISSIVFGRFVLKLNTNFYFGVAGLNTFPHLLFFVPYYSLAIIAFFGHISGIHYKKMKYNLIGFSPKKQSYLIFGIGLIITFLILFGLTEGFNGVEIPTSYDVMKGNSID